MSPKQKSSFWKNNSLSIVFFTLLVLSLIGQIFTGHAEHNQERTEIFKQPPIGLGQYLTSGHFFQATFENWQSEFLQMAAYVVLTVMLYQKGSAESKDPDKKEPSDARPRPHPGAPFPVKQGGLLQKVYENSLALAFAFLFIVSWGLHLYGSFREHNDEQVFLGKPTQRLGEFLGEPAFWFESFQNWQSEFMSVLAIVVLSIFLRQKGSPESKPVDAPHSDTGAH